MARQKEPRTHVIDALAEVRRHTLALHKLWKNRSIEPNAKQWRNLANWCWSLANVMNSLAERAIEMANIEENYERKVL